MLRHELSLDDDFYCNCVKQMYDSNDLKVVDVPMLIVDISTVFRSFTYRVELRATAGMLALKPSERLNVSRRVTE